MESFDIVAVCGNKVECRFDKVERSFDSVACCFDIVAGVDGALPRVKRSVGDDAVDGVVKPSDGEETVSVQRHSARHSTVVAAVFVRYRQHGDGHVGGTMFHQLDDVAAADVVAARRSDVGRVDGDDRCVFVDVDDDHRHADARHARLLAAVLRHHAEHVLGPLQSPRVRRQSNVARRCVDAELVPVGGLRSGREPVTHAAVGARVAVDGADADDGRPSRRRLLQYGRIQLLVELGRVVVGVLDRDVDVQGPGQRRRSLVVRQNSEVMSFGCFVVDRSR